MSPSSVDFPLPEGPVTATTSPAATSRLTPSRIVSEPAAARQTHDEVADTDDHEAILHSA